MGVEFIYGGFVQNVIFRKTITLEKVKMFFTLFGLFLVDQKKKKKTVFANTSLVLFYKF
jgi:hypothetical protein